MSDMSDKIELAAELIGGPYDGHIVPAIGAHTETIVINLPDYSVPLPHRAIRAIRYRRGDDGYFHFEHEP